MAASAESFDNCQSSSPCRPFSLLFFSTLIMCGAKEVGEWYRSGPGANSFSFLSFREELFYNFYFERRQTHDNVCLRQKRQYYKLHMKQCQGKCAIIRGKASLHTDEQTAKEGSQSSKAQDNCKLPSRTLFSVIHSFPHQHFCQSLLFYSSDLL